MLTLTDNASTLISDIAQQIPEASGLRIATGEVDGQPAFEVTPVADPEPGDQVLEQGGATVYLDQAAALELDDKVLDAAVDQGTGSVQFGLAPQG
jgi:Fe-S cluster assembly iron-binding protein IscA